MKQKTLKLREVYREGQKLLKDAKISDADLDAWYLLEHVTGITRTYFYAEPDKEITQEERQRYDALIEKRCERIPLQHLTGTQMFMGIEFSVNEHVLIPRQDTEILVEEALKLLKEKPEPVRVLDLCTGSGCILLSVMKLAGQKISGVGVDISEEALQVAKENAGKLGIDARWLQSDLFSKISTEEAYDMIISNPPYIKTAEIMKLQDEVKLHDPYIALDGMEDGLYFYREIIKKSPSYLRRGGWLLFEIGYDQGEDVALLMKNSGFDKIIIKKDLAGLDRVVLGRYNES